MLAPDAALIDAVWLAADAEEAAVLLLAAEALAAAAALAALAVLACPASVGNGGADVPRPASGAKPIAVVRTGRCDSRTMSTWVCCLACQ